MRYSEVEQPASSEVEENQLVYRQARAGIPTRIERLEPTGTRPFWAVKNPIVYLTKTGERYFEHKQLAKSLFVLNPDCKCNERTYLPVSDNYYECDDCGNTHHVECPESTFSGKEDFLEHRRLRLEIRQNSDEEAPEELCSTCFANELNCRILECPETDDLDDNSLTAENGIK